MSFIYVVTFCAKNYTVLNECGLNHFYKVIMKLKLNRKIRRSEKNCMDSLNINRYYGKFGNYSFPSTVE